MKNRTICCFFLALLLTCCSAAVSGAQGEHADTTATTATTVKIPAGVPLDVILDENVPIKHAGVPVNAQIGESVFVFDRVALPAGTQVVGRVARVDSLSRKRRALAIANGDFTPLRKAYVDFDTLVLKDGTRIPLHAVVSQGAPSVVHLSAGQHGKKKGRVGTAVQQARQEVKAREREAVKEIKAPGKMQRLKSRLTAELPYRKQSLPAGAHFTAELKNPLELRQPRDAPKQLDRLGTEIPPGSTVHVRLDTALSSATDHKGTALEATVSEPVFSADRHLILPEGARLEGVVTQSTPARRLGRNGQLRFMFRQIQLGPEAPRNIEASLQGVDADSGAHLELDSEGGAHAVTPKTKYIAPAIDVVLATSSLDGLDGHHHHDLDAGVERGPDVAGGAVRGGAGFGLVGSVIGLVAHYRPVSAAFAFYGAGWSVYSHVVARGTDVVFPKNTPMEIRFGTHEGTPSGSHPGSSQKLRSVGSSS